jgi:putative heme-binding domain-containing protein
MRNLNTPGSRPIRCALVFLLLPTTAALGQTPQHTVEWIWPTPDRDPGQVAYLRRCFEVPHPVQSATLEALADFHHATLYLNGHQVAEIEDYGPALSLDVTHSIRLGGNILAARGVEVSGPAALALRLDIICKGGTRQTIVTDSSWRVTQGKVPGWHQSELERTDWPQATSLGPLDAPFDNVSARQVAISRVDDYTQWQQALGSTASDPSTFLTTPGFEIELVRSAEADQGSWVSMAFDPQGRLLIARESQGILRFTLPQPPSGNVQVETINETLEECRGLLFAFGDLYVNANNSKGLYRLRDTNGDDQFDEVKLLYQSPGGVGHGRNHLALGPDGNIYSIHGDSVDLPHGFVDRTSPLRQHQRAARANAGHVIRTNRDGTAWELVASGLRNPYGIDFNSDGELFTYDADAEYDMGAPWYRPTRVDHIVTGADFGWRDVTGTWPPYYPDHPDNALPNLDIGKGSPTAVKFAERSHFPHPYRSALFILDWAYGRVIAVHMMPHGSSYRCRAETFLRGRPLNVTDLDFGPDGAMYLVTGGRKTQSGLYRVRYVGTPVEEPPKSAQQMAREEHARGARALRHHLESFHGRQAADAITTAWPHLDSPDPRVRHAARIAIEHQPVRDWQHRALTESRPLAALTALMALSRTGDPSVVPAIVERLGDFPLGSQPPSRIQIALHTYTLCLSDVGALDENMKQTVIDRLAPHFPQRDAMPHVARQLNQQMSRILVELGAPGAVGQTLSLLAATQDQQERLHYLLVLRQAKEGWTTELRRAYFLALGQTATFQGGEGMPSFLRQIKADALASLSPDDRHVLASLLDPDNPPADHAPTLADRPLVRKWTAEDLTDSLVQIGSRRNFIRGKAIFEAALCSRCHAMAGRGGVTGPDLTSVASRFSRPDILRSILVPSDVVAEQYRTVRMVTSDGTVFVGQAVPNTDYREPGLRIVPEPLQPDRIVTIAKSRIQSYEPSNQSPMPTGLLDTFSEGEILDLLAYIEAGGDPKHPHFVTP